MVVLELALTLVLLVGAGLMIRSFLKLYTLDIGIKTEHLMTMRMELPSLKYPTPETRRAFYDRLEPRLAALPGADAVAFTTSVPPFGSWRRRDARSRVARRARPRRKRLRSAFVTISPEFFDTVGVQLRRGRNFNESDGAPGLETAIINERWPRSSSPARIRSAAASSSPSRRRPGQAARPPDVWRTIVGICPSLRHSNPQDRCRRRPCMCPTARMRPAA